MAAFLRTCNFAKEALSRWANQYRGIVERTLQLGSNLIKPPNELEITLSCLGKPDTCREHSLCAMHVCMDRWSESGGGGEHATSLTSCQSASEEQQAPGSRMMRQGSMPELVAASAEDCNARPTSAHTSAYVVCSLDAIVPGSPRMCIRMYGTPKRATYSARQRPLWGVQKAAFAVIRCVGRQVWACQYGHANIGMCGI